MAQLIPPGYLPEKTRRRLNGILARPVENVLAQYRTTDGGDYSNAMARAEAVLAAAGGGTLLFPEIDDFPMNHVITTSNVWVEMYGGAADDDQACIRPHDLSSAALTIGDGTTVVRNCGLRHCHISGTDGTADAGAAAATNAPQAVHVRGGAVNFQTKQCDLYGGLQTLALVPSATLPVTGFRDFGSILRNDITNSASARAIYGVRIDGDHGYYTDIKFYGTKVSCTPGFIGYAGYFDGSLYALHTAFIGSYWDFPPGKCIYLKGSASLVAFELHLDPGATGAVVLETDDLPKGIHRIARGSIIADSQLAKWGDGTTTTIPTYAWDYARGLAVETLYLYSQINFSDGTSPFGSGHLLAWGFGSPEGSVTAHPGSLYLRTSGGAGATFYVKETGTGSTGWVAK